MYVEPKLMKILQDRDDSHQVPGVSICYLIVSLYYTMWARRHGADET